MCSAVVIKLPEALDSRSARKLGREMKSRMGNGSHGLVLDFSRVRNIDLHGIEGLLACMEELARQDGGLQLSGVCPEVAVFLELTRVNQLMQKFPGFSIEAPQFDVVPETAPEQVPAESPTQVPVAA